MLDVTLNDKSFRTTIWIFLLFSNNISYLLKI